ncbi:hypothetical protein [Polyangium aurulentum]|uniref:hypothetical protein n=1 Tax=Polyangium aurulentum TaxID=2567896 RepID=UPI0010AE3875|nr:hypothetical protein [Polyangium aurulentum]UQA63098.1 hypothetical protein E8A73_022600 [Polyangium aurulentum]
MNSSLRALSLVFASAALMLGPGQAIAGGDAYDDWYGPDILNFRACIDSDSLTLRYAYDLRDDGWYDKYEGFYDDDHHVEIELFDAYGVCAKFPGNGHGVGLVKDVYLGDVCIDDSAYRVNSCEYVGEVYLDELDSACFGNRHLVDVDAAKVVLRVGDFEACEAYVSECDGGW